MHVIRGQTDPSMDRLVIDSHQNYKIDLICQTASYDPLEGTFYRHDIVIFESFQPWKVQLQRALVLQYNMS